ncbi:hypothetical protein [Kitasatospora sp. NPDC002965]|uniref:hypothetical protein n=1 Tax=Kitasatospora sp. NPDC002965 TaxID=3154775 RepID=UPI0033B1B55D
MSDQPQVKQPQVKQSPQPTPTNAPLTTRQFVDSVDAHTARVNLAVQDFQAGKGGGHQ